LYKESKTGISPRGGKRAKIPSVKRARSTGEAVLVAETGTITVIGTEIADQVDGTVESGTVAAETIEIATVTGVEDQDPVIVSADAIDLVIVIAAVAMIAVIAVSEQDFWDMNEDAYLHPSSL